MWHHHVLSCWSILSLQCCRLVLNMLGEAAWYPGSFMWCAHSTSGHFEVSAGAAPISQRMTMILLNPEPGSSLFPQINKHTVCIRARRQEAGTMEEWTVRSSVNLKHQLLILAVNGVRVREQPSCGVMTKFTEIVRGGPWTPGHKGFLRMFGRAAWVRNETGSVPAREGTGVTVTQQWLSSRSLVCFLFIVLMEVQNEHCQSKSNNFGEISDACSLLETTTHSVKQRHILQVQKVSNKKPHELHFELLRCCTGNVF